MTPLDQLIGESAQLTSVSAWGELAAMSAPERQSTLSVQFDSAERFAGFSCRCGDVLLDFSRQRLDADALRTLFELADQRRLEDWIGHLFAGSPVNNTEGRAALHMALRCADQGETPYDGDIAAAVRHERRRFLDFATQVREGAYAGSGGAVITDVVNIGIGGSDLGLVMAAAALNRGPGADVRTHFVSNIDGGQLADVLSGLRPESTLFVICSKSFTTLETRLNAEAARAWLTREMSVDAVQRHFVAVSVNDEAMDRFGVSATHRFRLWDWVGGRYSLWSAIGLTLAIAVGADGFRDMLAGAANMDEHFRTAAWPENLPVLLGLIGVWNRNFVGAASHAVLPYDYRLRYLPAFLQQLEMESNGKSVSRDGTPIGYDTGAVIWGESGSNAQHSFFQLLHQGTELVSLDFVAPVRGSTEYRDLHREGLANMLAQADAFARGHHDDNAHKTHAGGRPVSVLLIPELSPASLGALIAAYEHKVFTQSVIWGINPFDQWGVELGKRLATDYSSALSGDPAAAGLPPIADDILRWRK